VLKQKPTMFI